jgi:YHS domain-containing protein
MRPSLFLSALLLSTALAVDPTQPYPLSTCIVSGDKLDAMGRAVVIHFQGSEVRFCCHDCAASFQETPTKFLAKLQKAAQKQ